MGQVFRKLFDAFFGNSEMRVVMLGLDAAGKTTILYKLHIGEVLSTVPTIGFNVEKVQYKNVIFTVWDVGGQEKLRPLWRHYFNDTNGLIYVVDSLDRERISKAKAEFQAIINDPFMINCVILVFANKQDMVERVAKKTTGFSGSVNNNRKALIGLDFNTFLAKKREKQQLERWVLTSVNYKCPFITSTYFPVCSIKDMAGVEIAGLVKKETVDSYKTGSQGERQKLYTMFKCNELGYYVSECPSLVAAKEREGAMTPMEVCEGLGLYELKNRKWHIQGTCALRGDGLYEGLDWLASTLKDMKAASTSSF
ncbi:hypothetical protein E3N88_21848 [Mikania micrantha]|uniref:ADP-ribosylation factor n=1 Tax=Mikania micrantha TaxID=192012 RepID=A0A5N6NAB3_9ASTR|nr:hypothetical protein E3N88_21848 [Mikania micrantha]